MKKRIVAMVLCFVMLMSFVPMTAMAQGAKKDIMLSSIDLDNRQAEFLGLSPEDADKVSLDFDKVKLELQSDMTAEDVEDVMVQQGCVKIRGVVTENAYTGIGYDKELNTDEAEAVVIDIVEANTDLEVSSFLVGSSNAGELIGKSVIAYVREVDNAWEIIKIEEDSQRNDSFTIGLSQFDQINASGKFEYYESETAYRTTSVRLDDNVTVVYNNMGGYQIDDIFGDIVPEGACSIDSGQITLIDNDDVYGYDVIFVEIAETAVVDFSEYGFVSFKNETILNGICELEYYEDETERMVKVIKNDKAITLSKLEEWDVLSIYAASDDAAYIVAEVIDSPVVGTITGESTSLTSATGKAYTINGVKYDATAGAYGMDGVMVGDGGEFYIDKYGRIAAYREENEPATSIECDYAYVMNVGFKEEAFADYSTAVIQLVTAEGLKDFNLKGMGAKLNGSSVNADNNRDELKALKGQMIYPIMNSSEEITSIITLDYYDATYGYMYDESVSAEYDSADNCFIDRFDMDANAFIFFIDPYDSEDSHLGLKNELVDGEFYNILGRYVDETAMDYNIVIISADVEGPVLPEAPDTPENEGKTGYAYVTAAAVDEDMFAGTQTAILQLVTADGVVALNVSANAELNGGIFNADDYTQDTINEVFANRVIKYSANSSDEITNIAMADNDEELTGGMFAGAEELEFDAANSSFVNGFDVDENASVFFVDEWDAEASYEGTTEDLIDGVTYEVWGHYATEDVKAYNIVIVKRVEGVVSPKAGFAVIENVGTSENMDGERILSIKYFSNGETIIADTTWEVYDEVERYLTPGDIVKLNINKNGIIDALEIVYDFDEGVRANYADSPDGYEVYFNKRYDDWGAEAFAGGVVENYKETSTVATIDGQDFKLSHADNIIVIDANGRKLSVDSGSTSSFKYFADFYDEEVTAVDIAIDGETFENVDIEDAKLITDNVFVRAYDGRVTDVVIVKGPDDVRIRGAYYNSLSTLSVGENASTIAESDEVVVKLTNLTLTGESAENYNLTTDGIYAVVSSENLASLNVAGQNVTVTGAESGTYLKGAAITLTATANSGYGFKGWYADGRCVCADETYEFILESDVKLTAKAERILGEIEVDLTEDEYDWYFGISIDDNAGDLNYYAALYDKNDRMLSIASDVLVTDDVTTVSIPKRSDAAYAKIHIVDKNLFFAAISKKIEL